MRFIKLLVFFFSILMSTVSFADCPAGNATTIVRHDDGTFAVIPPIGFSYAGKKTPILATEPIFFHSAALSGKTVGVESDYYQVAVNHIQCWYKIGKDGRFGIFSLVNNTQIFTSLATQYWIAKNQQQYVCNAQLSQCLFKDDVRTMKYWR